MKQWNVIISKEAQEDMKSIYRYIAYTLCEPVVALNLINRIDNAINSLSQMPERMPLYARDIRRMNVDHYAVFFRVLPQEDFVLVDSVIYGRRDIDKILEES